MGLRNDIRELLGEKGVRLTASQLLLQIDDLIAAPKKVKCESPPTDPALIELIANSKVALFIRNDDSVEVLVNEHTGTAEALVCLGSGFALIHSGAVKNDKQ